MIFNPLFRHNIYPNDLKNWFLAAPASSLYGRLEQSVLLLVSIGHVFYTWPVSTSKKLKRWVCRNSNSSGHLGIPMRIAIIGSGLAGLGVAFYLTAFQKHEVTIFDTLGIGKAASGAASGLAHPYAGEQLRRSLFATEALDVLVSLLDVLEKKSSKVLADRTGIVRYVHTEAQKNILLAHAKQWKDVTLREDGSFLITSGLTLNAPLYLEVLAQTIEQQGGVFKVQKIASLKELQDYDQIVIAAGMGSLLFSECASLQCQLVKGQIWTAQGASGLLEKSLLSKGYVTVDLVPGRYHLGATYDRTWQHEDVEPVKGLSETQTKIASFFPGIKDLQIVDCLAGVRVVRKGHYFPIAEKLSSKTWVLTALGSRGILYHAYLGKQVAEKVA